MRRYAQRMLTEAIVWSPDRPVLRPSADDYNSQVEVRPALVRLDAATGLCVAQFTSEPDRWYLGGLNDDHVLLWNWEESETEAWEDLW
jgi:hypothetical protein